MKDTTSIDEPGGSGMAGHEVPRDREALGTEGVEVHDGQSGALGTLPIRPVMGTPSPEGDVTRTYASGALFGVALGIDVGATPTPTPEACAAIAADLAAVGYPISAETVRNVAEAFAGIDLAGVSRPTPTTEENP